MPFTKLNFEVIRIRRDLVHVTDEYDELGNLVVPDELGNDTVVEARDSVRVAGWSVPSSAEPKLSGHDRRTVQIELFAPVGTFRPNDAVVLPERDDILEVIGEPENYQHNPFGWSPGLEVVNLGGVQ